MKFEPKEIPEGINTSEGHPVRDFFGFLGLFILAIVIFFFASSFISDFLFKRVSPEQEVSLLRDVLTEHLDEVMISGTSANQTLVDSVFDEVLQAGEVQLGKPLEIHLIQSLHPNAFCALGGHFYVTQPLVEKSQSRNELFFVFAHELGHFMNRDAIQRIGRMFLLPLVSKVFGLGTLGGFGSQVADVTGELGELKYGRDQETNADLFAAELMVKHYGHIRGGADFFTLLQNESEFSPQFGFLSTHPLSEERIQFLDDMAVKNDWPRDGELELIRR